MSNLAVLMNANLNIRENLRHREGFVYLLPHDKFKVVKIGYRTNVDVKLKCFKREYSFTEKHLKTVVYFQTCGDTENWLHHYFKKIRTPVKSQCGYSVEWYSIVGKGYFVKDLGLARDLKKLLLHPSMDTVKHLVHLS